MKKDRKSQTGQELPKTNEVKNARRKAAKSTLSNGKHPPASYEHAPIGIVEASLKGKYINVNEEFCRMTGYEKKELLRRGIKDFTHEDDYAVDIRLHEQLVTGKIPFYRLEKRFVRKDGSSLWVELTRSLVLDVEGSPLHTVGVMLDISDRKDVERVLRESVERLRLATESARMFTWEWDFQKQLYKMDDNFEKVIGFSAGLLPQNQAETVFTSSPPEDRQAISDAVRRSIENRGDLHSLQYRMINPENGQIVWLEANGKIVYDEKGNAERMFGVAQNITESKQTLDQIAIISRFPAENPNPVMRLTPDGEALFANGPGEELLQVWREQNKQAIPDELQQAVAQVFTSGVKKDIEIEHQGKFYVCTLAPILEAGYVNFYGNDITQRKRAEAALQLARRQAEKSADRTARLQEVTAALSAALTPPQVAEVLVNQGASAMGAVTSSMMLLSEETQTFEILYSTSPSTVIRLYKRFPVSLQVPAGDAVRSGEPVWIESQQQYLERYPHLADQIQEWGHQAAIAVPMIYKERILGVLAMSFDRVVEYNPEDRDYALTLAHQGAQALDRARAEDALRESEERFRALVSQATAGIIQIDLDGKLTFANEKFAEMLGFGEAELIGKTLEELTYEPDWTENQTAFERLSHSQEPFEVEQRLVRCEGSTIWASVSMSPLLDADGKMHSSIAVVIDITERKLAEEWERLSAANLLAAAEANAKFRTFFDQGSYFAWVMALDGTIIEANRLCLEFCGYSREDVIGKKFWDCGWWNPSPELMDMIREGTGEAAEGKTFRQESSYFMADGSQRYVDMIITPVRDDNGRLLFLAPTGTDITERKQMEDAIRESEERFRALVSQTTAGISETDMYGTLILVNPRFCEMLGYTESELLGRSIWDLTYPEDLAENKRLFERMLSGGDSYQFEKRFLRMDGSTLWTNVTVSSIRDLDGKPRGGVGVIIDIEERKRTEAALQEYAREQGALYRLVDQLHRTVSFDDIFNAALDAIISALQCDRASILLFDDADVMRFVAWRDLSDDYRKATDGHSPWTPDAANPEPIAMNDVATAELSDSLRAVIEREGIGSLAFIPLISNNRLIGKFMIYFDAPHAFHEDELDLSLTIARQLAFGVDRKRAEEKLRESEERYRFIVENTSDGIWSIELSEPMPIDLPEEEQIEWYYRHAVIRQCNLGLARMYGYSSVGEVVGLPVRRVMSPENPFNEDLLRTFIRSGYRLVDSETRELGAGGRELVFLNNMVGILEDGKLKGEWGTNRDITERKRAEEALRASEERYRGIVNQTIAGIAETDLTGRFTMVNDRYCEIVGYTREELLREMQMQDLTHPDDLQENLELFARLVAEGASFEIEKRYVRRDNSIVWVHNSVSAITSAAGKPQSAVAAVIDITERKRAEEALRRNEELFSTLIQTAPFGVYFIDSEFRLRAINKGSEEVFEGIYPLLGRDFAEILRILWKEPFATEAIERFRHTLRTGESFVSPPVIEPRANIDEIQSYDWQIHRITMPDGTFGVVCYFYDLSEQKRMEAAVRASEALYRAIASNIPGGGIYVVDHDFRYLVAEGPVTDAFGLSRAMLEGHTVMEVFPDERGKQMEERLRRSFAGETISFETHFGGRTYWTRLAPLHDSIGQAIILTLDITERKQVEEALQQSEERFSLFMQHLPGLAWIKDMQGRYVYANAAAEKAFSTPHEKLFGKTDHEIFSVDLADQFKRNDERALADGQGVQVIETLEHSDGILHYSLVSKFPIPGPDGNPALIGGTAFDITERLRAEEALRESEERFRAILRQATAGIVRKDAEGRLIFVNEAFCNMLGYTEAELLGKTVWDFMHEEDIEENKRSYGRMMLEGTPFKLERRLRREDGSVIWVDASVSPLMDAEGKPQSAVAVEVDITGRKQAEEALHQLNLQLEERVLSRTAKLRSVNQTLRDEIAERQRMEEALRRSEAIAQENEAKLRSLFELLPVGISFLDLQGQVVQTNTALLNILHLTQEGFQEQIYQSRKYIRADGTPMQPAEFASVRAIAEKRTIYNVETGIVLEDGEVVWTSVSATPVDVADVSVVVVTVDITENKRAEQALKESHGRLRVLSQRLVEVQEEERRALARELHDRVGQTLAALNINLIIINSQLSPDLAEQIGTRLDDSMKLVAETIALVRDVMTDLRPAVLDDYGLQAALESHLSQFIARYEINVKFEKSDPPIPRLGPSIEMTFLRIAQEALMNIARHARATQVHLSLRQQEDEVCLTIQDNGIGIQSWQDANRPGSHGLTIMRERAEAFGGSLRVRSIQDQGTTIEASIPIQGPKEDPQEQKR